MCYKHNKSIHSTYVWDEQNETNGVFQTKLEKTPQEYYIVSMKSERDSLFAMFMKEYLDFNAAFVRPFAKWYCYLKYGKTPLSKNITMELKNSPLYDDGI